MLSHFQLFISTVITEKVLQFSCKTVMYVAFNTQKCALKNYISGQKQYFPAAKKEHWMIEKSLQSLNSRSN